MLPPAVAGWLNQFWFVTWGSASLHPRLYAAARSCGLVDHLPAGSQTGRGFSIATHLTFLSFRLDIKNGFSNARSSCFTWTSQFQIKLIPPISVERIFERV